MAFFGQAFRLSLLLFLLFIGFDDHDISNTVAATLCLLSVAAINRVSSVATFLLVVI